MFSGVTTQRMDDMALFLMEQVGGLEFFFKEKKRGVWGVFEQVVGWRMDTHVEQWMH